MAIYNPKSDYELKKAKVRFNQLVDKGKPFKLEEITKRSLSQNAKFHVLIGQIAFEMGNSAKYVKLRIVKLDWCRRLFYIDVPNVKTGEMYKDIRSSKKLSIEEMREAISIIIEKAALELNMVFPENDSLTHDDDWIRMMQEVEKEGKYL